jgi:hypothetical protein
VVGKKTRDDILTASIYSNAIGNGTYKSPQKQLQENIRASEGISSRTEQNLAMELGDFFEEHIIRFACQKIGLTKVITEHEDKYTHPFFPVECSLDGTAVADNITIETDPAKGIYVVEE